MIKSEQQAAAAPRNNDSIWSRKPTAAAANDKAIDDVSWNLAAALNDKEKDNTFLGAAANNNNNISWGAGPINQSV